MLLRASGDATGISIDLRPVMEGSAAFREDLAGSEALLKFSEAAVRGSERELDEARARVLAELGPAALVDAAAVVGNFERMVRIADSTGIPLDDFLAERSADFRHDIGIEAFSRDRSL